MARNQRSAEAASYRKWYKTKRWQGIREQQFARYPLCAWCLARGEYIAASICHHMDPASKATAFFAGPFLSLCKPCHDRDAQSEERTGFSKAIGADGWPTDERHPANRLEAMRRLANR